MAPLRKPSPDRLRLRVEDDEDLAVLSTVLQDALVPVRDIAFLPGDNRLAMVVNRYKWEGEQDQAERVLCAVAVESVRRVRRRGIDQTRPGHLLSILAVRRVPGQPEGAAVEILFAGGGAIRVEAARLLLRAEDVEEPYPTAWHPKHPVDDPSAGTS